jgi:hypothetical protein
MSATSSSPDQPKHRERNGKDTGRKADDLPDGGGDDDDKGEDENPAE